MEAAVVVKDLTKRYGRKWAIQALNFEIQPGCIVGFLGPNGAGKSTTLRILCGLMPADEGCVYINGCSMTTQLEQAKRIIGYMPESNPLPEDMRVREYLRFRAFLKRVPRREVREAVNSVMERCDLHRTAADKMIGQLSKGFKQRVGIAEALLGHPKLVILDEPTIGLDPHQILSIREVLRRLKGETTVIFSSHILPEVEEACTHLVILNQGKIVANGSPQLLRECHFKTLLYALTIEDARHDFEERLSYSAWHLKVKSSSAKRGDVMTYEVETETNEKLDESAFTRWIFENRWPLLQFVKKEADLEDLFLKLTSAAWKKEM